MKVRDDQISGPFAQLQRENYALKQRLEHLENAAKGASEGLWDWDLTNDTLFVSASWKEMLGIPAGENVSPKIWEALLHEQDRAHVMEYFSNFIKGNVDHFSQEFRLRHRNGQYRWVRSKATAMRDMHGRALRVSGASKDITEQRIAQNALEHSEKKYRNLFQNSLVAMGTMKSDLTSVIDANEKFWSYLGVPQGGKQDLDFGKVLSIHDRRQFLNAIESKTQIENFELRLILPDGSEKWSLINAVLYPEEQTIDFVLKDITQTKENLIELQKVNFELDSFVYHASHDLRSPLRSVLGLIELYRMEDDQKLREECIDKIQLSVRRLDDLVVELLSISRNDRVDDAHAPINLLLEINNSITSYYNATDTRNLEISSQILQPVPFISDPTRVRIILNNLISNAIKYRSFSRDRSTIDIFAEVTPEKTVIRISDNGEGIEESKLPHIFDMFYRATERSEGSGLGLYIVKKVADKLEASIEVESVELEGTTFTVTIPNSK